MKYINRIFSWVLLAVTMMFLFTACSGKQIEPNKKTYIGMGTIITQTVYAEGDGQNIASEIEALLSDLENKTLSWRVEDSELGRINQTAGAEAGYDLSEKMEEYLSTVLQVAKESNGAFDPTIGPLVQLWNIDAWATGGEGKLPKDDKLPTAEEIQSAKDKRGYEKVSLKNHQAYVDAKVSLDFGAVGKGIACDEIAELLESKSEVKAGIFSVGGNILTYGTKPDASSWQVGITDPMNTDRYLGTLSLEGGYCVSTSGDYERFVEVDGVKYHHILDPQTGYPARSGIRSVTVVSKSGILGDTLSTACFVAGQEEALRLAKVYNVDMLIVTEDNEIIMTEGLERYFTFNK